MSQAVIFDITRNSYVDGPGVRTTVFFKGCNLHCAWCHNPESQSPEPTVLFYRDKCCGCGKCVSVCKRDGVKSPGNCTLCGECAIYCPNDARQICGKRMEVSDIFARVKRDSAFYSQTGGGVTCSGGECLLQPEPLTELLRLCRGAGIRTAVDTAAAVAPEVIERVRPYTDLFLLDLKCMNPETHKKYTGAGNALILENLKRLLHSDVPCWVRVPVIPGVNDTPEEIAAMRAFLRENPPERVELLPYHTLGVNKHRAAGMGEQERFETPSAERLADMRMQLGLPGLNA